jgi:hypothetical protein
VAEAPFLDLRESGGGVLLPEEAGDFDREFLAAMAQATQTLGLTGVLQLLESWRRVAESSRDARAHRRLLGRADRLGRGGHCR